MVGRGSSRRVISIRFDSESSDDDLETMDDSKEVNKLGAENEDIRASVTWALDNLEDLILQIASDEPIVDNKDKEKQSMESAPMDTIFEVDADPAEHSNGAHKISTISQKQADCEKTTNQTIPNKHKVGMDGLEALVTNQKELSKRKRQNNNFIDGKSKDVPSSKSDTNIHQNILNICEVFQETLSKNDLDKIMGKVQPLLEQIGDLYDSQVSKPSLESLSGNVPSVSGPPPPAPPPPPPPSSNLSAPKFKIRKQGATLTASQSNGSVSNIEIRIKKHKEDDMISQLQKRLQNRQNRQTLANKYANLDIIKAGGKVPT